MSRLRFRIAISLDGYVAGPNQSVQAPLGEGGMGLHEWVFPLEIFRRSHGGSGGEVNASTAVLEECQQGIGATLMGRNMFGGQPGPWDHANPWLGWWGEDPPYHHPVVVLTHHPRATLPMQGGTHFEFVTEGLRPALDRARALAGGQDVTLAGGAAIARQALAAGLVDEMWLHLVPRLLGAGERLFDDIGTDLHGLILQRTVAAPGVVHLQFVRP